MEPGNPAPLARGIRSTSPSVRSICAHPPVAHGSRPAARIARLCALWSLFSRVRHMGRTHRDWVLVGESLAQAPAASRALDQLAVGNPDRYGAAADLASQGAHRK